ncbi:peptide N-acetyl-beta-D-glucosaminyl asparaginase amidase A-domain-containing protein [Mucidula mucida]|nr:peptide N-acetyl-beta-D-glucosaminyl asparaginase amidase A-domain-containing protein [Mucidula mucida]
MYMVQIFLLSLLSATYAAVLEDFQVTQPPIVPVGVQECTVQVLQRDFAFSFGMYELSTSIESRPPTDCGPVGSWSAITLNFTVTSNGTQFDRLGIFTFKNVEIWRTSTPEPTRGDGIIWTYIKDVTKYMPLFETTGTFILQLDNLIQTGLDGVYSTILQATYYASTEEFPPAPKADLIVPLSTLANDTGNDASVPPAFSLNVTLPVNTVKIFAELFASGNSQEEFWYLNAANDFISDLPDDTTFPQGPFRELRLLVDGQVAGAAFPYAVIFTGGINPSLWRPISAYGALDEPTYFIDVITDSSSAPTTGNITVYDVAPFAKSSVSGNVSDSGADVDITVSATRNIHIESTVVSGSGEVTHVVWTQNLTFSNVQSYRDDAVVQLLQQTAMGHAVSKHNDEIVVLDTFSYPLDIDFRFDNADLTNWTSAVNHSYDRVLQANPLVLGTTIHNVQNTDGFFQLRTGGNFGNGTNSNTFSYVDTAGNTFNRRVNAALNVITLDEESGTLAPLSAQKNSGTMVGETVVSADQVRLPGKGSEV